MNKYIAQVETGIQVGDVEILEFDAPSEAAALLIAKSWAETIKSSCYLTVKKANKALTSIA